MARGRSAVSEFNWASGQMPKPLNDEVQEERQADVREEREREHVQKEAARSHRPWWKFWARDAK
jgi:hypothetical protein